MKSRKTLDHVDRMFAFYTDASDVDNAALDIVQAIRMDRIAQSHDVLDDLFMQKIALNQTDLKYFVQNLKDAFVTEPYSNTLIAIPALYQRDLGTFFQDLYLALYSRNQLREDKVLFDAKDIVSFTSFVYQAVTKGQRRDKSLRNFQITTALEHLREGVSIRMWTYNENSIRFASLASSWSLIDAKFPLFRKRASRSSHMFSAVDASNLTYDTNNFIQPV